MFSSKFEMELNLDKEHTRNELNKIVYEVDNFVIPKGYFESIRTPFIGFVNDDDFTFLLQDVFTSSIRPFLYGELIENDLKTKVTVLMEIHEGTKRLFRSIIILQLIANIVVYVSLNEVLTNLLIGIVYINTPLLIVCLLIYHFSIIEQRKAERIFRESLVKFSNNGAYE